MSPFKGESFEPMSRIFRHEDLRGMLGTITGTVLTGIDWIIAIKRAWVPPP